jgi:hypothetical protein
MVRGLLQAHSIRYIGASRRIMYLHNILHKDEKENSLSQKADPSKGDCETCTVLKQKHVRKDMSRSESKYEEIFSNNSK